MSRPRQYKRAAEIKRDPHAYAALAQDDESGDEPINPCEHITGWSWPEPDASRTFPGVNKQESRQ